MFQDINSLGAGFAGAKPVQIFPDTASNALMRLWQATSATGEIAVLKDAGNGWWEEYLRIKPGAAESAAKSAALGMALLEWHGGQGTGLYATGSTLLAGETPGIQSVKHAIHELSHLKAEANFPEAVQKEDEDECMALVLELEAMFPDASDASIRDEGPYVIEVLVSETPGKPRVWRPIRPSGSKEPYEYDTKFDAEQVRRTCYGDPKHAGESRVTPKSKTHR